VTVKQRVWFDRRFTTGIELDAFPEVLSRVEGAPPRLEELVLGADARRLVANPESRWSAQEHVGHLGDLESLWSGRLDDLLAGEGRLRDADLTNRATDEAHHNGAEIAELTRRFRAARSALVARLAVLTPSQLASTALHPRLERPMSVVDLFFFVAEHDDHHLAAISRLLHHSTTP
jgi:uncharacterized damage-inducible protein DinB